jgi:large subunit ribosomal protein L4
MPVIDLVNKEKKKVSDITLSDSVFDVEIKKYLLHDVVKMQLANKRCASAKTKTRSEIAGSGAKPWRQKGTGRARAGTRKSPIWRGGGTIFGPTGNENYKLKLPKKVVSSALKVALSVKCKEDKIIALDEFKMDKIKTKDFVDTLQKLETKNCLFVINDRDENIERSSRNVSNMKVISADHINVYDILRYDSLVLTKPSIEKIEKRLG